MARSQQNDSTDHHREMLVRVKRVTKTRPRCREHRSSCGQSSPKRKDRGSSKQIWSFMQWRSEEADSQPKLDRDTWSCAPACMHVRVDACMDGWMMVDVWMCDYACMQVCRYAWLIFFRTSNGRSDAPLSFPLRRDILKAMQGHVMAS